MSIAKARAAVDANQARRVALFAELNKLQAEHDNLRVKLQVEELRARVGSTIDIVNRGDDLDGKKGCLEAVRRTTCTVTIDGTRWNLSIWDVGDRKGGVA